LPGQDVTLVLQNGTGQFFSATVPAVALVPNATGTRVRFRDPTSGHGLARARASASTAV